MMGVGTPGNEDGDNDGDVRIIDLLKPNSSLCLSSTLFH